MVDQSVVNIVQRYLRALQAAGLAVRFGVIFGSWTAGKAGLWSDIDLLVVSPRFDGPFDRQDVNFLWRQAARIDSRIEPIACGEQQWQRDDSSAVIEIARREGTQIAVE
ncbi:MAG: nucleotidyltransferase domain-containing protein [Planctomycetes bacterium]|nr:nucleotidyltransferase domain-containing protein [Planctomycetota bacterium]MBU4397918.1 nucleotidyltransferase domain-containing protein [Planctomycetota bacterium]MCG2683530.1 nucleotidyltransferase domain-containing protein [Planctomycetales bacterium]